MNLSNTYRARLGDSLFNQVALALPGQMYVALYTDSVDGDGSGTEVGGGVGYARQQLPSSPAFTRVTNEWSLSADVVFGPATGSWGTVVSFGLWNAAQDTLVAFGDLASSVAVASGESFVLVGGLGAGFTVDVE